MYDELDRWSRSVVVWLKEVRYPLAAGAPEEGLCLLPTCMYVARRYVRVCVYLHSGNHEKASALEMEMR